MLQDCFFFKANSIKKAKFLSSWILICRTAKFHYFVLSLRLTKHHAMKACWGSAGIAPHILLRRHYMQVSRQLHAPAALPPGKAPLAPTITLY